MVVIRPAGAVLIAQALHFPEHFRACPRLAKLRANGAAEGVSLAGQLIDAASGTVDWANYRDDSAHELRALVERKLQGHMPNAEPAPAVLPFLQALQQSVARTEQAPPAKPCQRKAPAPKQRKRRA